MVRDGFTWGSAGKERFTQQFGVIETIERTKIEDNACSKKNKTEVTIRRKPGASPLLFGKYLMDTCAFVSLEDISDALPAYREDVVSVELAGKLKDAYQQLQDDITATLQEHRGNRSVLSTMLNALLVYPDHPYGLGTLYGSRYNPEIQQRETFVIAETEDLDEGEVYPKEQALIDEIKSQLARGRKCQVFAVYTNKYDVTARLEKLLRAEGIRAAVLRASTPTHKREAWYREQLKRGIDVAICHPKLVEIAPAARVRHMEAFFGRADSSSLIRHTLPLSVRNKTALDQTADLYQRGAANLIRSQSLTKNPRTMSGS